MVKNFTQLFLQNLKFTKDGYLDFIDKWKPHASGGQFGLRVGKMKKTFWVRYTTAAGKKGRTTIGHFPAISLADARDKATKILILVHDDGFDPQAPPLMATVVTLASLWDRYAERRRIKGRDASLDRDRARYLRHIDGPLGSLPVKGITRMMILTLTEAIAKTAPIEGNRVFGLISGLLTTALDVEAIDLHPMSRLSKPAPEHSRDRILNAEELRKVWKALSTIDPTAADCFKVLMFTGQRSGEVRGMQWTDIDFDKALWTMTENKSSRKHEVPLSDPVMEILNRRRQSSKSPYVFHSQRTKLKTLTRVAYQLSERSGVGAWVAHDLRRTARSMLAEQGTPVIVAEKVLNHSLKGLIGVYDRHDYALEMRAALDQLAARILDIVGDEVKEARKVAFDHGRHYATRDNWEERPPRAWIPPFMFWWRECQEDESMFPPLKIRKINRED